VPSVADVANGAGTSGVVTGRAAGMAVVSALYGGHSDGASVTVTSATLNSITVSPPTATLAATGLQAFTATGIYSDGSSLDITTQVTWSSDDTNVATVSNAVGSKGLATAIGAGKTLVHASLDGRDGSATIVVTESALKSLAVLPESPSRHVGERQQFAALGAYVDGSGKNLTTVVMWSSSNPGVATISTSGMNVGQATCVGAGTATITATYMGISDSTTLTCTDPDIVDLQVTPFTASATVGGFALFNATAIYSDASTRDVSNMSTWNSSDTDVAIMISMGFRSGIASAQAPGTTTVKATYMGLSATATLTVTDADLLELQVTPVTASVKVGQNQQFQAVGLYSDGSNRNLTFQATWESSDPSVADVSNAMGPGGPFGMPRGQATGLSPGTTTIKASYMGFSDSGTLTVTAAKIVSLDVSPVAASLIVGDMQQYQVVALFDDGTSNNVTFGATWTSSDDKVADISNGFMSKGQATALAGGTTTITAAYMGLTGTASLTVIEAKLLEVQVTPTSATLQKGTMQMYQAVALYSDGSSRNVTFEATWDSSNPAVADASNAFGSKGVVTAVSAGAAVITATFDGLTGKADVTVTDATLLEIQVTPTTPLIAKGTFQNMTATAIYSDFSTRNVTGDATWTSSDPSVASASNAFGSKGRVTGLAVGTATVTATWMGVSGGTDVTVSAAGIKEIQVTPAAVSIPVGLRVRFSAVVVYTDDTTDMITGAATWTSSDTAVATVSNAAGSRGLATTLAPGVTTITATYMGQSGSATLTVGSQKLVSIAVTPADASMSKGTSVQYTATGTYDDASVFDLTGVATWISTSSSVAAVSNAEGSRGLVTAVAAGGTSIEAHFGGVTGSTGLTVTD